MTRRDLQLRLRALLRHRRVDDELDEELAFHLEMQARKLRGAGADDADAQRLARARFGSTALVADQCRDARGIGVVETLLQDVRYALRSFRRAPAFALTVVGTIALGLGLNTAVFTIFNAYVLKPFAVRDPYSLYAFEWRSRAGQWRFLTWPEYEEFRRDNPVFSEVFAERRQLITRIEGHAAYTQLVSGNYFRMLGVDAAIGRVLEPADASAPGRAPVAVISHAFWQRAFGGDPAVIGRIIFVQGHPCEVIGVAREGFGGLDFALSRDVWAPITLAPQLEDGADLFGPEHPRRVGIVGRLKPGVTVKAAEAALLAWAQATTRTFADDDKAAGVLVESRATSVPPTPMTMLAFAPIVAAFALVLLIACANVANMMLARGMARQREIGIRLTLGAWRARLVRQLLTESVLLALPAAAVGFAVSRVTIDAAVRIMFATLPSEFTEYMRVAPLPPDLRVLAFMLAAAVATGIVFGLAPALQTTRSNIVSMARGDFGSDFGPARLRRALVVVQITASVMLLITAAVLVRSAQRLSRIDPGVRTRDIITLDVRDSERARVVAALGTHPIVVGIAGASAIPLDATAPDVALATLDRPELVSVRYRYVSPSYFDVFDLPILSGRTFTTEEAEAGAPVAILSAAAAARLWPDQPQRDAVGRVLRVVPDRRTRPGARIARFQTVQVIGIARDSGADLGKNGPLPAAVHFPASLTMAGSGLVVRVSGEPEAARRSLDTSLAVAAPGAVQEIHKLQEFVSGRVYPFRAAYWVAGVVGGLALLLTVSGLYGVLSYLVTQRAKEISIRMALGANTPTVVSLVIAQSMRLAAIGLPAGVLLALGAAMVFASKLVMIDTFDAFAYLAGALAVFAACLAASFFPALRAARLDPMTILRAD
jgi:predicted permease